MLDLTDFKRDLSELTDRLGHVAADDAYTKNGGSFKELLVSLLTSDSFLYRKELKFKN